MRCMVSIFKLIKKTKCNRSTLSQSSPSFHSLRLFHLVTLDSSMAAQRQSHQLQITLRQITISARLKLQSLRVRLMLCKHRLRQLRSVKPPRLRSIITCPTLRIGSTTVELYRTRTMQLSTHVSRPLIEK